MNDTYGYEAAKGLAEAQRRFPELVDPARPDPFLVGVGEAADADRDERAARHAVGQLMRDPDMRRQMRAGLRPEPTKRGTP